MLKSHTKVLKLMGNRFELTAISASDKEAQEGIKVGIKEVQRIEKLLTTFSDHSITNQVNTAAGIQPVEVPTEFLELVIRAQRISELTQGAFDISYGSIDKSLWNFDLNMTALPDPGVALESVHLINYKNIEIDTEASSIYLKEKGMRIGFGGIGKGYAAEMAKQKMKNCGIMSGVVNAAGDLTTWGQNAQNEDWTVGVADPDATQKAFSHLKISNMAVATSGNYEKYVTINGVKYSHTINPRTGMPVGGIKSVTIICPNAELADALATPVMVMGTKVGLDLINQMHHIACVIIDDNNRMFTSKNITLT